MTTDPRATEASPWRDRVLRVIGTGLAWSLVWTVAWAAIFGIVWIVDPESIDPGEPLMVVVVLGPMGFLTGIALGVLRIVAGRLEGADRSLARTVALGAAATALVQIAYLGHGDQGLAANVRMALGFCAFGSVVTMVWLLATRWVAARRAR